MMNIIRADIYRLIRGKAIYITFALLLLMNVLTIATSTQGGFVVDIYEQERIASYEEVDGVYNGVNIAEVLYKSTPNLIYILLALIIAVVSPMFSNGAVKNSLSYGMPRSKLYLSKLIFSSGLALIMMLLYMLSGILFATMARGFGGAAPDGYWLNIIKICCAQSFMLLAMNSIGIFLAFVTKRTAAVIGAYMAFCLVPTAVVMLLMQVQPDFIKFFDYEIQMIIMKFGSIAAMETSDFVKSFTTGALYILAPTAAGIMLFKRAEIK